MSNLTEIEREWKPICTNSLFEIPTDNPVICMEHIHTKERAYYAKGLDRLLSQQESFDFINGSYWAVQANIYGDGRKC